MTECRECRNRRINTAFSRGKLTAAARLATRLDHPRYVEAANKAKAAYIKDRDEQMAHVAACDAAARADGPNVIKGLA